MVYDLILQQTRDVSNSLGWITGFFYWHFWPWPVKLCRADLCCHYWFKCTEVRGAAALEMDRLWSAARALESLHGRCGYVLAAASQLMDPLTLLLLPLRHQNSLQVWRRETAVLLPSALLFCTFNVNIFKFFNYLRDSIRALKKCSLPPCALQRRNEISQIRRWRALQEIAVFDK